MGAIWLKAKTKDEIDEIFFKLIPGLEPISSASWDLKIRVILKHFKDMNKSLDPLSVAEVRKDGKLIATSPPQPTHLTWEEASNFRKMYKGKKYEVIIRKYNL